MVKDRPAPYVITFCQQKGGVGKTTSAVCLGAGLAQSGNQVLLLDLAPAGNLTTAFGINLSRVQRSIVDLFHNNYPPKSLIRPTSIFNLNIIPASESVNQIPQELPQRSNHEFILNEILIKGDFPEYDFVILDCSPGIDSLTINALACADLCILPVVCEYFALQSLDIMFRWVLQTRKRINAELDCRLLITKMDRRASIHQRIYAKIEEHYKDTLLKTLIGVDIKLPESQLAGMPIFTYDPQSRATRQYQALTDEILNLTGIEQLIVRRQEVST